MRFILWVSLCLELRRNARLLALVLPLWLLFCSLGIWSGAQQAQRQKENARLLQTSAVEQRTDQLARVQRREQRLQAEGKSLQPDTAISRNPALLAQQGTPALLTPLPLAWASIGQSPLLPQGLKISLKDPALLERFDNLQPPLQLWAGYFDLVFVLVYILPLLLIAISFDLHTTEQQNGTLRLLVVQAGQLRAVLAGKVLARLLILASLLFLLSVWTWLGLRVWLALDWSWLHWFYLLGLVAVYGSLWLALAAWLNCFRWPAAQVASALATLWLIWVWLLPATGQQLLHTLYPVPSRLSYLQQQRAALEMARRDSAQLLGAYLEDHPELAGGADNRYALLQLSKEQAIAQALRPLVQQYQQQLARQQTLARGWVYLSPVSLTEQALMHLAGSDLARYQDFEGRTADFQVRWQAFFMPLITEGRALNSSDFAALPVFVDTPPATPGKSFGLFVACLLALLLGCLMLTWRAWRNYQIV